MLQARSWLPRMEGSVRLAFACRGGTTHIDVLHQAGAARARFPKSVPGAPPEAVLLNMAGGLTGGDRMDVEVALADGAEATLTTAAAEKIDRARDDEASEIRVRLALGAGARLTWLPQATILFKGSQLNRHTEVELAGDATFLAVESLIFGRKAMGEELHHGTCRDAWHIRRDGTLVFADAFRVRGAIATALDRPATLAGARAAAMLIYVATDAGSRLAAVRAMLDGAQSVAGVSAWNGLLVVRAFASDGRTLQADIAPLVRVLGGRPLPRLWQC